jgi:hypothetical protein
MAEVTNVSTTPNPDAMKFTLDRRFDEMFTVPSAEDAESNPFAAAVFSSGGVASVFGTADFVTITRAPGADWDDIESAVRAAAAEHL